MNLLECKNLVIGYGAERGLFKDRASSLRSMERASSLRSMDRAETCGVVAGLSLEAFDFDLRAGEVVALMGANGSGKSTLLKTLSGVIPPVSGCVRIDGAAGTLQDVRGFPLHDLAKRVALVRMSGLEPGRLTVREFVGLGRIPYAGFLDGRSAEDNRIVDEALALLDVSAFASRAVAELSDGERSRVYLAQAVAQQVKVLLLDEPNAFLDIPRSHRLFRLLRMLAESNGVGIVVSTHSVEYAEEYADRIMVLDGGRVRVSTAADARGQGLFEWTAG